MTKTLLLSTFVLAFAALLPAQQSPAETGIRKAQEELEAATKVLEASGIEADPAVALFAAQRAEARLEAATRKI